MSPFLLYQEGQKLVAGDNSRPYPDHTRGTYTADFLHWPLSSISSPYINLLPFFIHKLQVHFLCLVTSLNIDFLLLRSSRSPRSNHCWNHSSPTLPCVRVTHMFINFHLWSFAGFIYRAPGSASGRVGDKKVMFFLSYTL